MLKLRTTAVYVVLISVLIVSLNAVFFMLNLKDDVKCFSGYAGKVLATTQVDQKIQREAYKSQNTLTKDFDGARRLHDPKDAQLATDKAFNDQYARLVELDKQFAANKAPEAPKC